MTEPTCQLTGIHHVRIPVTDLDVATRYWHDLFGYEHNFDFDDGDTVLGRAIKHTRGGPNIVLWHDPDFARATTGFQWFAIGTPNEGHLQALATACDARGIEHGGVQPALVGRKLPFIHDPDDHLYGVYFQPAH